METVSLNPADHGLTSISPRSTSSIRPSKPTGRTIIFTYIWMAEGQLYVAVVLALRSRGVVGWSLKASRHTVLVMDALMLPVWRRGKVGAWLASFGPGLELLSIGA
jgi:transposase InsO family protein